MIILNHALPNTFLYFCGFGQIEIDYIYTENMKNSRIVITTGVDTDIVLKNKYETYIGKSYTLYLELDTRFNPIIQQITASLDIRTLILWSVRLLNK